MKHTNPFIVSLCPTQVFKRRIFDNFRFSAKRILNKIYIIIRSSLPQKGVVVREGRGEG